jgi:uncharacterized Ntn-hydrolase superfamily protein
MALCLNTFSVVARCPRTGHMGVAVSTALLAVGGLCPYIVPLLAAASTQSWVNPYLALDALEELRAGAGAADALKAALAKDGDADLRQIALVDAQGGVEAWTGAACTDWAGHRLGDGFAVQGNMLVGPETLEAMDAAMTSVGDDLADRLVAAMVAGQHAGGDKRGKQSAALKVYGAEAYPLVDLRVDDHSDPVAELARLHELAKVQLHPFVASLPRRRSGRAVPLSDADQTMIMLPPDQRAHAPGEEE